MMTARASFSDPYCGAWAVDVRSRPSTIASTDGERRGQAEGPGSLRISDQQRLCACSEHKTCNAVPRETAVTGQTTMTRLLIEGSRQVPQEDPGRGLKTTPTALPL